MADDDMFAQLEAMMDDDDEPEAEPELEPEPGARPSSTAWASQPAAHPMAFRAARSSDELFGAQRTTAATRMTICLRSWPP